MAESASLTTTLIGDEIQDEHGNKWSHFADGKYLVNFNPIVKSLTEIGPDFGDGGAKWASGVRANTCSIYCACT
jgi:hypothetical protein